ncbi:MAG: aminotransferase class I/II-fold pyridoxal phosphate-dependent enzyme [Actinomycetota bacterium]|nr:aminotransferase class I/II-fold pyridoxal phosphate-dependent enzyme [Actinomycetota bacterium]
MTELDPTQHFDSLTDLGRPSSTETRALDRLFGASEQLLPLWIAEPYVPLSPPIVEAIQRRAADGWYGYESRPRELKAAFWDWMTRRHDWDGADLKTTPSPSVGTSIGALIELFTDDGDGVILQPPVFTDFKPLIRRSNREPIRNSLVLNSGRYEMDLEDLESKASDLRTTLMILCNPHNPVGRAWSLEVLQKAAVICARHDVFVVADEIHADLMLGSNSFTPFAVASEGLGLRTAATHGPIKTFGLAGVADTLLVADEEVTRQFRTVSGRLHLSRSNVFSLAAMHAAYSAGDEWLDDLLELVAANVELLTAELPEGIGVVQPEATYLAWVDFRSMSMDVPELSRWLVDDAHLALSPGHWFGREGAGFARMTIAAPTPVIEQAVSRLTAAVEKM